MRLNILYRGPLSSCNYECVYCPFSKQVDTKAELEHDRICLERFVDWVVGCSDRKLGVFFTPWGEALTRRWYWATFERLTSLTQIEKVAIQTNLSSGLDWLDSCDVKKIGIWATYHPSQCSADKFLAQVDRLRNRGVDCSVGMVGVREDIGAIELLRRQLSPEIYLWVNANKSQAGSYSQDDLERLSRVDPLFSVNNQYHRSFGLDCDTGETSFTVDGEGDIRRCHFVKDSLGNLYRDSIERVLRQRTCPNQTCGCHIGYVHMPSLRLGEIFQDGILERVPAVNKQGFFTDRLVGDSAKSV